MKRLMLVWLIILVTSAGCGGVSGDDGVEASIVDPTVVPTTLATTTTQAPIGTPFTTEGALEVPGISDVVGSGSLIFTTRDGQQLVEFQNVSVPAVDGKIVCPNCAGSIVMDSDVILSAETFHDPDYSGEIWYIVAGPEGATLDKVGAGFRLVEGSAFLVDDLSSIDSGG